VEAERAFEALRAIRALFPMESAILLSAEAAPKAA
jgi:flagellar biosynthesis regulator FlbT